MKGESGTSVNVSTCLFDSLAVVQCVEPPDRLTWTSVYPTSPFKLNMQMKKLLYSKTNPSVCSFKKKPMKLVFTILFISNIMHQWKYELTQDIDNNHNKSVLTTIDLFTHPNCKNSLYEYEELKEKDHWYLSAIKKSFMFRNNFI